MDDRRSLSDYSDYGSASDRSKDCPPSAPPDWSDDCSDYGSASDRSKDRPPTFNSDGNQPEDIQRKLHEELKSSIEELRSEFDRNRQTLIDKIKELNAITDELESMHKGMTIGSLVGSTVGAAGGIAAIAGVCIAPFILGASLVLTVGGAVAGAAGGVAGAAANITNTVKLRNLHETFEKITNDFQNTVQPINELLDKIYGILESIELVQKLKKHEFQRAAKGAQDIFNIAKVADLAQLGKICAEGAKELREFVKAVNAARGPAQAAKAARAVAGAAKEIRVAAAFTGGFSALFHALDVYSIFQDSRELSERNQPVNKRKADNIKSETLEFILHTKETADQFQKTVDTIRDTIETYS